MIEYEQVLCLILSWATMKLAVVTFAFGVTYIHFNSFVYVNYTDSCLMKCLQYIFIACKRGGGALYVMRVCSLLVWYVICTLFCYNTFYSPMDNLNLRMEGLGQLRRRWKRREGSSCWAEAVNWKVYYLFISFYYHSGFPERNATLVFALSPVQTGNPDVFLSALFSKH